MKLRLAYPVKNPTVNRAFGVMPEYYKQFGLKGHNGIDFGTKRGQEVYAAHDGVITHTSLNPVEGVGIVLKTQEKFDFEKNQAYFKTVYWHLLAVNVKVGQAIKAGQMIGWADSTGVSTGDHLHFALKPVAAGEKDFEYSNVKQKNGYFGAVDPQPYFAESSHSMSLLETLANAKATLLGLLAKLQAQKEETQGRTSLYPAIARKRDLLVAAMKKAGHPIRITSEVRTLAEQAVLYAQGRTTPGKIVTHAKPGESWHNWGCAFDVVFVKEVWSGPWDLAGTVGKGLGLEWGGDWPGKKKDRPHFQYTGGYGLKDFQAGTIDKTKFS